LGFIISCILHALDLLHRLSFEAFKNCSFLLLHSEVYPLTVYAFGGWIFEANEVFTQPWTMWEVTALILLQKGVDKDEYFGFGQCLRSWVQSLTIKIFVYYRHIRKSPKRFKKSPRRKKQLWLILRYS
jgi:hypothetical protein